MNRGAVESGGIRRALFSIAAGLLLAALLMQVSGSHPGEAFSALWSGATGLQSGPVNGANKAIVYAGAFAFNRSNYDFGVAMGNFAFHCSAYNLANSLARMTPLLFAGLAVAVGLRAGLFNIGASGQMAVGAIAAAVAGLVGTGSGNGLPPVVHIPLALLIGAGAGALWGAIPGLLKARRGVHEVIVTIMLNFVAANSINYLLTHNLKDNAPGSMASQTSLMARSAWLPLIVPNASLSIGFLLALCAAVAVTVLIKRTALGYEIRAVGLGAEAAQAAGIPVPAIIVKTMALSGALAGLAGAVEVMGIHHRYLNGAEGSYGFDGIAVALLGGLSGPGCVFSAAFFGLLGSGAQSMQLLTDVPATIAGIIQAIVIICIGIRLPRRESGRNSTPAAPGERQGANAGT